MDTPPPYPSPAAAPKKKGLHPVAWVGIGCGVLLLIGIAVIALTAGWVVSKVDEVKKDLATGPQQDAAEAIDGVLPEIEIVAQDQEGGTVTFRQVHGVEESTLPYADFLAGEFTLVQEDGTELPAGSDLADVPAWVPRYPRIREQGGVFVHKDASWTGTGSRGVIQFTTDDAPDAIASEFETAFGSATTHTSSSFTIGDATRLSRTWSSGGKRLELEVFAEGSKPSSVIVKFSE